eukprot:955511-Pleurochrysis_carterae.AAC.2
MASFIGHPDGLLMTVYLELQSSQWFDVDAKSIRITSSMHYGCTVDETGCSSLVQTSANNLARISSLVLTQASMCSWEHSKRL